MSMYAISDKTMPLHLILWGSLLGWAAVTWRGSSTQVHAASQEKDLTLKFHQIRVARWCFCHMTYSYPNCKVLYEDYLISSHIFILDTPNYLTPPLPVVGKTRPGWDAEDLSNHLEDGQKSSSNLNTLWLWEAPSVYIYTVSLSHIVSNTYKLKKNQTKYELKN